MNAPLKNTTPAGPHKIVDKTNSDFNPKEIIHVILKPVIKDGSRLEFDIDKIDTTNFGNDMVKYIASLPNTAAPLLDQTPFDIALVACPGHQVYVLVELDSSQDWCFTPDTYGMDAKNDYNDDNFGLEWLEKNLNSKSGLIVGDECRHIWLRIRKRAKCGDEGAIQQFNYYITFKQGAKRMRVVFDPDVRNDGGGFP